MTATAKPAETDAMFERHRARAFSVAYRIVGSVSDAEEWCRGPAAGAASTPRRSEIPKPGS